MAGVQAYEAIVVDGAPDGAPPGHIVVQIPELFGFVDLPFTIAPWFPGPSGGGWHCVPTAVVAEEDDTDSNRVIVLRLAEDTFRWLGTSQPLAMATDEPGVVSGASSPNKLHYVKLHDTDGVSIVVQDAQNSIVARLDVKSDGTIELVGDGTTEWMLLSETFVADLASALTEVQAALMALALPTTNLASLITGLGTGTYLSSDVKNS